MSTAQNMANIEQNFYSALDQLVANRNLIEPEAMSRMLQAFDIRRQQLTTRPEHGRPADLHADVVNVENR